MTKSTKPTSSVKSSSGSGNYAIVEASGTQFWLETNRYYEFDRIKADVDEIVTLNKVLLINDEKGTTLGKPYIEGASVDLKVLAHRRGSKIIVYKMRPKKKTRRKNGHRQELTRVMVQSISFGSQTKAGTKSKSKVSDKSQKTTKDSSAVAKKTTAQTKKLKTTAASEDNSKVKSTKEKTSK